MWNGVFISQAIPYEPTLNLLEGPDDGSGAVNFWVNGAQYDDRLPDPSLLVERAKDAALALRDNEPDNWETANVGIGISGMCATLASRCERVSGTAGIPRLCPEAFSPDGTAR